MSEELSKSNLTNKYVKIAASEKAEAFKALGDRRQKGELGQPYYTTENDKGYFYYIILKTI